MINQSIFGDDIFANYVGEQPDPTYPVPVDGKGFGQNQTLGDIRLVAKKQPVKEKPFVLSANNLMAGFFQTDTLPAAEQPEPKKKAMILLIAGGVILFAASIYLMVKK